MADKVMRLKLVILNHDSLEGMPKRLQLDRRSAVIGRSPKADWTLPDSGNIVSAHHCAISFRGGQFFLTDVSTNGTLVNSVPLVGQHRLVDGDVIGIGHYRIAATLEDIPKEAAPLAADLSVGSLTRQPAPIAKEAAPLPSAGPVNDVWQRLAAENFVDWQRGGFGRGDQEADVGSAANGEPQRIDLPPEQASDVLLAASGLVRSELKLGDAALQATAGRLLKRLVAGLVVMLEARARAKSQMGAQPTNLEFDGNNPLKFARTPEHALTQLVNPPERGYMSSDRAIEDAFLDLQAHQLATLKAMQGALRATLERFSPAAIRQRGKADGLMSRLMPTARDAALWRAYEAEFGGVAAGSDEAFMQLFGKEFRKAYETQMRSQGKDDTL